MRRALFTLLPLLAALPGELAAQPRLPIPGLDGEAQDEQAQAEPQAAEPIAAVRARRRELSAEMARIAGQAQSADEGGETSLVTALTAELDLLERIDGLLTQMRSALQRQAELTSEQQELNEALAAAHRGAPTVEPPYDLAVLDRLRARLDRERARSEPLEAGLKAATTALREAGDAREKTEARVAVAKRNVDAATGSEATLATHRALRLAELRARIATTLVELREVELDNAGRGRTAHDLRREFLDRQIEWVQLHLKPTPADLETPLVRIERDLFSLRSDLNTAKLEATSAENVLAEVEARLAKETEPNPALVEEVAAARLALLGREQTVTVLGERLERLEQLRQTWERRYAVLTAVEQPPTLDAWLEEARTALAELEREADMKQARLVELRASRGAILSRLARQEPSDPTTPHLRAQDAELARVVELYEADLAGVAQAQNITRWHADESRMLREPSPVSDQMSATRDRLVGFWNYRLTTIDGQPITPGKVIIALLLLVLGYIASRFLARLFGRRLQHLFSLNPGGGAAIETLSFYGLYVAFALIALKMVNVPLTAFTVLGGALAIGVGFGSQNVVNNFISGLILLIEQPIKVDDLIEVDGTSGKVEHIGARSTRVRNFANIHMIVPNSSFLEKNVINWTLSDSLVRVDIKVGVAYGSPTGDVARLLQQAVEEHPDIESHPEPVIFFADFGDNALAFEALFWIRISTQVDRRRIQSDVRFRIDELFRDAGIVIAFPQRDVHLDTLKPLEVKMVAAGDSDADG